MKKSRLGKGLDALIPKEKISESGPSTIEIERIKPNESQPRKSFDQSTIDELAASIREKGLIQPLVVRKSGNEYEIIAGERRWRASKAAGLKTLPVVIIEADDTDVLELALIENLQREDLNPIEEAEAYKRLVNEFKLTHDEISKKIGKDRSTISNQLRLLKLTGNARDALVKGLISAGHARALISVENPDRLNEHLNTIIARDLSVRETEKLVKSSQKKSRPDVKKETEGTDRIFIHGIEDDLKRKLGTKVRISGGSAKGKIEIEYYSADELDRLIGILKSNR